MLNSKMFYEDIEKKFISWSQTVEDIRAAFIVGSRARNDHYTDCNAMLVGTGDVPSALSFYQKCGFSESHRIYTFFTDNYDHPMFEDGKQLVDMVYLKRER